MKQIGQYLAIYFKKLDKWLVIALLLCSSLSVLLLYSIFRTGILSSVGASYYRTQLFASILGIVIMLILALVDYHKIVRLWFLYAPVALLLTLLTFTALGERRAGADDQAWLNFGFIRFQPSEVLKLAFAMTFSLHLAKDEKNMNHPLHMLLLLVHGMIPIGLIALQGDYGTAIVFGVMFLSMLLMAKISWKYVLAGVIAIPVALYFLWNYVLGSTHKNRILVLLHPGTDPEGLEYQQDLGLSALSSGELFGKGLFFKDGVSVPEMHNDFIFSYVGETFGFVGAMAVVVVLTFLCLKVLFDGVRSNDKLGTFLCVGIFGMLFAHCFLNIGMVLKVMPVIGIPLPFLSAGGTAILSMYVAMGLVLSVYSHNEKRYRIFYDAD